MSNETDTIPQWYGIETAPSSQDEVDIWIFGGKYHKVPTIVKADGEWWQSQKHVLNHLPTHWQPVQIPQPPEDKVDE